jgi:hypothetical protein
LAEWKAAEIREEHFFLADQYSKLEPQLICGICAICVGFGRAADTAQVQGRT